MFCFDNDVNLTNGFEFGSASPFVGVGNKSKISVSEPLSGGIVSRADFN